MRRLNEDVLQTSTPACCRCSGQGCGTTAGIVVHVDDRQVVSCVDVVILKMSRVNEW